MTDMQIAIGLGRKASDNASLIFVNVQVLGDDAANEIPRHFIFSIIGRGAFTCICLIHSSEFRLLPKVDLIGRVYLNTGFEAN